MDNNPAQTFWDKVAVRYAARPVRDAAAYADTLADVAARLRPSDRVLEIGCGTGTTATRLGGGVAEWTGADFSPGMVRIAQAKPAPAGVRFILSDADTVFDGSPFDAVCAFHLLHLNIIQAEIAKLLVLRRFAQRCEFIGRDRIDEIQVSGLECCQNRIVVVRKHAL